jgi:Tol biopolymer transport system component
MAAAVCRAAFVLCPLLLALLGAMRLVGPFAPGDTIAFESDDQGNDEIYVVDTATGRLFNVTRDPARDFAPVWSPDGRLLLYLSSLEIESGNRFPTRVMLINLDTGERRYLYDHEGLGPWLPQWAPDSRRFAVASNFDIYVVDIVTGIVHNVSNHPVDDGSPVWSPDGRQLVFVSHRDDNYELYLFDVETGALCNLTQLPAGDLNPAQSAGVIRNDDQGEKRCLWANQTRIR